MQDERQQMAGQQENRETVSSTQVNHEDKLHIDNDDLPTNTSLPQANFKLFSFIGDNSKCKITNWIKIYERFAKRSKWTETEMVENLPSYLADEAFEYYASHILNSDVSWKSAKQQMIVRFDQYEVEPFMQFLSLKWNPQTELKEYFKKMRAVGMDADLKEEDIVLGLTRGLPMHLRSEMSTATTLRRWVAVAFCLEQRLDSNGNNNFKNNLWKNRRNHRNLRQNKSRSNNQQQNLQNDNISLTNTDQIEEHN